MRTIWKFAIPFPYVERFELSMPNGAQVLCVQTQDGDPCLWAIVDTLALRVKHGFFMHWTGTAINEEAGPYVGTFQAANGVTYHVFEATV